METEFRWWLRDQLRNRNWTAAELARRSGFLPGTVSRWLNGSRKPAVEACYTLADLLDLPTHVVLQAAGHPTDWSDGDREKEDRVVSMFRRLTPEGQDAVVQFVEFQRGRERREQGT